MSKKSIVNVMQCPRDIYICGLERLRGSAEFIFRGLLRAVKAPKKNGVKCLAVYINLWLARKYSGCLTVSDCMEIQNSSAHFAGRDLFSQTESDMSVHRVIAYKNESTIIFTCMAACLRYVLIYRLNVFLLHSGTRANAERIWKIVGKRL